MFILITNDDGVLSPGLKTLADAAAPFGEIAVIAPDVERSGVSHAITLLEPLRCRRNANGYYALSGTPADCVFVGMHHVLGRRPDLVLAGINRGPNLGGDVLYSGTVGGATEATIAGIPAVAFSLVGEGDDYPFDFCVPHVQAILAEVVARGMPDGTMLNVNIPAPCIAPLKGWRVTRLGRRFYSNDIIERHDPRGQRYLWIGGTRVTMDSGSDTDTGALHDGYITISPVRPDLMARDAMAALEPFNRSL